jgi:hypothetical protein
MKFCFPRDQVPPAMNRPRTRLQDNIVKPKIFSNGMMRYDCKGLGVTREAQTLSEALRDEGGEKPWIKSSQHCKK